MDSTPVTPSQAPVTAEPHRSDPDTCSSHAAGSDAGRTLFIGPLPLPEPEPMTLPAKAVCVWCGRKVKYTSDAQAREHFAYCGPDCKAEMDNVFSDDMDRAFNKSQRLKKTQPGNAPPWVKKPKATPQTDDSDSKRLEAAGV